MTSLQMRQNPLFLRKTDHHYGQWNIPEIRKTMLPDGAIQLIACSDTRSNDTINKNKGVHFFVDDYRFEAIYRNPEKSWPKFSQYRFLLTPDYSLYADMPMWRQIESVGKSRWCGSWWQERGVTVIPTVSWSNYPSYTFCFDGIAENSCVAVGMIGCKGNRNQFMHGYDAMLERICPEAIICFGKPFQEMRGNIIPIDYLASRRGGYANMGGRGTYALGNNVPYTYKTVGYIDGVKVLQGLPGYKGLPVEAHSSCAYIQLHPDGTFRMLREFDNDHYLLREIAYHPEPKLTGNHAPILHIHEYQRDNFYDRPGRLLTDAEKNKYKRFFKGVKE